MGAKLRRSLWRCPECGHRFVTSNMWHSCARYSLTDHFRGKDPQVRTVFDAFRDLVRSNGPVTIYPQKTRITFQGLVRFAAAIPRKHWLDIGLWLTRQARHPALRTVERYAHNAYDHSFRLTDPVQMDRAFANLVKQAYAIGQREHVDL